MTDEEKPNALEDLRKGLGLLFRAAKTTLEKLPTGELEAAVISGAKEVGRAIENVSHTVEEQILRKPSVRVASDSPPKPESPAPSAAGAADAKDPKPADPPK
jgi:hypothetical protein